MRSNELRIGNWVQSDPDYPRHIFGIVKEIKEDEIISEYNQRGDRISMPLTDYKSIPLTPEILEKAGFEYYAWPSFLDFTHYIKNDFILRETGSGYSFFNTSSCDNSERQFLVQLSHLHQLQNLYFALTGEELPIEL